MTRNGLPIQLMEYVRVPRMARDPTGDNWAARLVVDRFTLPENVQASPLESDSLDDMALHLTTAFEAATKGQLEVTVTPTTEDEAPILCRVEFFSSEKWE